MVSIKKNYPQRVRTAVPYKKPFKPGSNFNQIMFNASQIPDNIYTDFNNPTPPISYAGNGRPIAMNGSANGTGSSNSTGNTMSQSIAAAASKKKPVKQKQKGKQSQQQTLHQNGGAGNCGSTSGSNGNWNKTKSGYNNHSSGHPAGGGSGNMGHNSKFVGSGPRSAPGGRGRRMMMPPLGPPGLRGGPIPPMPPMPPHGFQPPPPPQMLPPPLSRMGRGPPMAGGPPHPHLPPPPPFLRRTGRSGGPPTPHMMPPMMPPMIMPPRMPRVLPPGIPPYAAASAAVAAGKIKKQKLAKKVIRGKSTIKTLKNLVNQYPLDKPWVTTEIRAEHDKKLDMENRLKGNKDDDLFAQFKVQRDKFVSIYEAAREEYLKQEAAAVKAKDAKDTKTNTCKTNADTDEISKEAISKK